MTTTVKEVTEILERMIDNPLAQIWLSNDFMKKHLAISYDEWIEEYLRNNIEPASLEEHINYYLKNDLLIKKLKEQSE